MQDGNIDKEVVFQTVKLCQDASVGFRKQAVVARLVRVLWKSSHFPFFFFAVLIALT